MALTDRGKACLAHVVFYSIEFFVIGIAYVVIFGNHGEPDDSNIVGDNPGLSYRPQLTDSEFKSVISFKSPDRRSFGPWADSLETFLEDYRRPGLLPGRGSNIVNCDYINPPGRGQVCDIDIKNWQRCIKENYFDYHKGAPCVFLRLNMPKGWKPIFYNESKSLPNDMPEDLKQHIKKVEDHNPRELNTLWVSCEGETTVDKEFIGVLDYIPRRGFPGFLTLNRDVEGYLAPLVAIHFKRPMNGFLMNIKCKVWARNIKHDDYSSLGGVNFGLMIN